MNGDTMVLVFAWLRLFVSRVRAAAAPGPPDRGHATGTQLLLELVATLEEGGGRHGNSLFYSTTSAVR